MSNNLAHTLIDRGLEPEANTKAEPAQYRALAGKIAKKTATVAVCGMGYVGLPLARAITEQGFPVIGLDIDNEKVEKLNVWTLLYQAHPAPPISRAMLKTARFRASSDFGEIAIADIITICVPTPLNRYREPDLSYVTSTAAVIARQCATRSAHYS